MTRLDAIRERYARLEWQEKVRLWGMVLGLVISLYSLMRAPRDQQMAAPVPVPPSIVVQSSPVQTVTVQSAVVSADSHSVGVAPRPRLDLLPADPVRGSAIGLRPAVAVGSADGCTESRSQSLRDTLDEAEAYYNADHVDRAWSRYRCAYASLPLQRVLRRDADELAHIFGTRQDDAQRLARDVGRVRQLFASLRTVLLNN